MDYKIWFHKSLHHAVNRTFKMGFPKSGRSPKKSGGFLDCDRTDMMEGLWNVNSPFGPFDDPKLHQELDRLMARNRLS
jgi:hypothetical protein